MSRTVYTKEIMEALEIDATPMTQDQIFEREQAIENRWLEEFRQQEDRLRLQFESREPMQVAQAKIGQAAQSALHNKNVVIPSLYGAATATFAAGIPTMPAIDDNAVTEVVDATITYIHMGRDFEVILQAIKENPLLMSEWERFMLSLRLAQAD
jgi:hypothetical protein